MRPAANPMVYMPLPSLMFLAATLLIAAGLLSGCAVGGYGLGQSEPERLTGPDKAQTADYFLMEPTRLEKGHIFMRRSAEVGPAKPGNKLDGETLRNQDLLLMGEGGGDNQMRALPPHKWQNIRKVRVQVHVQNKPFQRVIEDVLDRVEPRTGPWRLQWKITRENRDLLDERFSLNTETTFDRFVSSVAAFIQNYRGVELNFELFEKERVLVISDVFPT